MVINNGEAEQNKEFIQELIYENIWLHFENTRLRKSLVELKRLERWWKEDGAKGTGSEGNKNWDNSGVE